MNSSHILGKKKEFRVDAYIQEMALARETDQSLQRKLSEVQRQSSGAEPLSYPRGALLSFMLLSKIELQQRVW